MIEACFKISYTSEQLSDAKEYIRDMKAHPKRVFWYGKENKSDEELIYAHLAHRILSGFYNNKNPHYGSKYILEMKNKNVND